MKDFCAEHHLRPTNGQDLLATNKRAATASKSATFKKPQGATITHQLSVCAQHVLYPSCSNLEDSHRT